MQVRIKPLQVSHHAFLAQLGLSKTTTAELGAIFVQPVGMRQQADSLHAHLAKAIIFKMLVVRLHVSRVLLDLIQLKRTLLARFVPLANILPLQGLIV